MHLSAITHIQSYNHTPIFLVKQTHLPNSNLRAMSAYLHSHHYTMIHVHPTKKEKSKANI